MTELLGLSEPPPPRQRQPFVPPVVVEIGRLSEMTLQISGGGSL